MNPQLKKKHVYVAITLLTFVLSNPTRTDFLSFLHMTENGGKGRDFNGLAFSVYSKEDHNQYGDDNSKTIYIGILGNFFKTPTTK